MNEELVKKLIEINIGKEYFISTTNNLVMIFVCITTLIVAAILLIQYFSYKNRIQKEVKKEVAKESDIKIQELKENYESFKNNFVESYKSHKKVDENRMFATEGEVQRLFANLCNEKNMITLSFVWRLRSTYSYATCGLIEPANKALKDAREILITAKDIEQYYTENQSSFSSVLNLVDEIDKINHKSYGLEIKLLSDVINTKVQDIKNRPLTLFRSSK